MPLLPEKFRRAKKKAGSHFPPNNVAPLVDQKRKVTPRLYPALICIPDYSFRRRPDDQLFFELGGRIDHQALSVRIIFQAVMRDDSAFLRKPFGMLLFFFEK